MSKVRDHMTTHIISASSNDSAYSLAKAMKKKHVSCVLIVDEGHLVGIVTENDFVAKLVVGKMDPKKTMAREIMTKHILSVEPESHIVKVATLMEQHKIKKMPVIDDGHLVGLITQTDLLKILCYK